MRHKIIRAIYEGVGAFFCQESDKIAIFK